MLLYAGWGLLLVIVITPCQSSPLSQLQDIPPPSPSSSTQPPAPKEMSAAASESAGSNPTGSGDGLRVALPPALLLLLAFLVLMVTILVCACRSRRNNRRREGRSSWRELVVANPPPVQRDMYVDPEYLDTLPRYSSYKTPPRYWSVLRIVRKMTSRRTMADTHVDKEVNEEQPDAGTATLTMPDVESNAPMAVGEEHGISISREAGAGGGEISREEHLPPTYRDSVEANERLFIAPVPRPE
ncbi:uncharacterized protein SPPG_06003 [Spizellomyces punctatus DAOM BR117]|uniref:Dystroglycan C-terminal domain-containing protein n=1 Tax=Spizellomyces punctatus (strain DAOM BR117) TaxID=645134 RepID=A0A0L0HD41_SPIPD|nr:uncharacterized protein SPPG_06003 [Spizellomyces punctatus DAOM BR117]KNC99052.1 hypothetical protein SPPG_06003 [Spizellomyces punctatus DAOM BR117]|eukprot:XP_016607092.1 hypothetical protein SPPG_06003 [Spizellomyces punctatus DAOM BR117]